MFYKISYRLPASQNMTKVICLENKTTWIQKYCINPTIDLFYRIMNSL